MVLLFVAVIRETASLPKAFRWQCGGVVIYGCNIYCHKFKSKERILHFFVRTITLKTCINCRAAEYNKSFRWTILVNIVIHEQIKTKNNQYIIKIKVNIILIKLDYRIIHIHRMWVSNIKGLHSIGQRRKGVHPIGQMYTGLYWYLILQGAMRLS